ncbi:MAG: hypothetical protein GYB50_04090 [Rhodobacteraceae bacterium]|nr:hypothetical protein [Paracoccaceae bacterium]
MCQIVPHPHVRVAELRAMVASPEGHDEAVVLDACDELILCGTAADQRAAKALQSKLAAAAVDEINSRGRLIRGCIFGVLFFAILVAFVAAVFGIAAWINSQGVN